MKFTALCLTLAGGLLLTGCGGDSAIAGSGSGTRTTGAVSAAPNPSGSRTPSATHTSSYASTSPSPSSATASTAGVAGIVGHGANSAACKAAKTIMVNVTTLGLEASAGVVSVDMLTGAFPEDAMAQLPAEAKPAFTTLHALAASLVGVHSDEWANQLDAWNAGLATVVDTTTAICS